jgi:hypothetical protein
MTTDVEELLKPLRISVAEQVKNNYKIKLNNPTQEGII